MNPEENPWSDGEQILKPCLTCKIPLPLTMYYRERNKPDGRRATCKECVKARSRAKRAETVATLLNNWGRA